jgi:hypothetical protein
MKLSKEERKALEESGITHAVIIEERIQGRYVNRLLRGRNVSGITMYGVWHDGESAKDIRWEYYRSNA